MQHYYEKMRNEKMRNMENPFKFGTIVEAEYFTDRVKEVAYISQFLESANHLDEFQEIRDIAPKLDKQLRSVMQEQKHINYVLLGSQESMMTDIFENKKSPFYHFGELMRLGKFPREDFYSYLSERLMVVFPDSYEMLSERILNYTGCHPYYSQQLAANVWQVGILHSDSEDPMDEAIDHIVKSHGLDYERLWMNLNRTNRWIMQRLAGGKPLQTGEYRTSTVYSALKRLQKDGFVIYADRYELEDPFFKQWILSEME